MSCAWVRSTGLLRVPATGSAPLDRCPVRLRDWREVYDDPERRRGLDSRARGAWTAASRSACRAVRWATASPTFNDHVFRSHWDQAAEQLFDTNNFPEFTGRLCPAPCESACVFGISDSPVTIERIEYEVAEHAFAHGFERRARAPRLARDSASPSSDLARPAGRRGATRERRSRGRTSSNAVTPSADYCATAFPSSSWRRPSSIDASRSWRPPASPSTPASR